MGNFLFEYGLFAAKILTLLAVLLLGLAALAIIINSARQRREKENITIEKINDKFDDMRNILESELLSDEEIKQKEKAEKKRKKQEHKEEKKRLKNDKKEQLNKRLFVIFFNGDMHASEVDYLRECITGILTICKDNDEVLVVLESSGGLVHSYGLAASQLERIKQRKLHLTIAVDLVAASGGYLMACVANKVIAAPFAIIGSIGVLAQIPNFNKILEKNNIEIEQHTAGEFKTTLTMLGKNNDKGRKRFKQELEDTHKLFKQFVKEHRPIVDIEKLATGEHWYGSQALEKKLVDEIITSDDYLLKKSATTDIYEIDYEIQESLRDKISNLLEGTASKIFKKYLSAFSHKF